MSGTVDTEGSTLRVRSEAGTTGEILTKLDHGTTVEVLAAVDNGWFQISYEGTTGYVSGDYLIVAQEAAASLAVQAAPVYIQVTEGPLNVRSGPDTSYEKVDSLATGQVVKGVLLDNGWYQTDSGYISGDYVAEVDLSASSELGQQIANYALQFVGYPYVYGGSSPAASTAPASPATCTSSSATPSTAPPPTSWTTATPWTAASCSPATW